MPLLIVLDDGETYCAIENARVVQVTDEALRTIQEDDERIRNLKPSDGILSVRKVQPEGFGGVRTWWESMR